MADSSTQPNKTNIPPVLSGQRGNLIVISGPSGVGKGTSVQRLVDTVANLSRSVSVTTRPKRSEEVESIDYFFTTTEEFDEMRSNGDFLEWAEFAGNFYATPKNWVENELQAGRDVILEIEVQGARQIRKASTEAVLIFLSPPSFEALEERLKGRATETPEKIKLRLQKAKEELQHKNLFNYEVVNDNLDETVNNLVHIVHAERCRIRIEAK